MRLSALAAYARTLGCTAEEQVSMIDCTSFKIGGPADVYITAPTEAAAAAVLVRCREEAIPVYLLGNGTNLLVGDKGLRGAVIRLDGRQTAPTLQPDGRTVQCSAGVSLKRLCQFARDKALTGLEFAFGIPGAVGGAVYMNAGAYGGQMDQVLVSATGLNRAGKRHTFSAERLNLGYRHSVFMDEGDMVVSATLRLTPGDPAEIAARMDELLRRRREKQPLEYPSAGSFFKRPPRPLRRGSHRGLRPQGLRRRRRPGQRKARGLRRQPGRRHRAGRAAPVRRGAGTGVPRAGRTAGAGSPVHWRILGKRQERRRRLWNL